ncbi:MAG: repeat variant [Bacteroidetes bacterium]|jgi:antitoxin component YwqK of YwqJK toxin-antitoxin module|nr:repeat variant [Bacteroidota bacterium]
MKIFLYISFILLYDALNAQSYEIYNNDTINRVDIDGKKQGKWAVFGKMKPGTCYKENQIIEKGLYKDNRKTGIWSDFYCNGSYRSILNFVNGRPDGEALMYHDNGIISEKGIWKNNHWVGPCTYFDDSGKVEHQFVFNSHGKREGVQAIKICDFGETNFGCIKESGISSQLSCDTSRKGPMVLNGKQKLYNKNKQITKDGVFKDNKFMDGKAYIYDDNAVLKRIAVYKNGVYVGDTEIER